VIIDPGHEVNAVREAFKKEIPIIALIDTDGNPQMVDIPIPGNDDAIRSIQIVLSIMADAVLKGREIRLEREAEARKIAEQEAARRRSEEAVRKAKAEAARKAAEEAEAARKAQAAATPAPAPAEAPAAGSPDGPSAEGPSPKQGA